MTGALKRMRSQGLLFCTVLWVGLSFGLCAAQGTTAVDFFNQADTHRKLAEFELSLISCDKAIKMFNNISPKKADQAEGLSRAYYLKANLLNIMMASEKEIKAVLARAVRVAPDFIPDKTYASNPIIADLLRQCRTAAAAEIRDIFDRALVLYNNENFCRARDLLAPVVSRVKDESAREILASSTSECQVREQVIRIAEILKVDTIGIFPVLWGEGFEPSTKKTLEQYLNQDLIQTYLNRELKKCATALISQTRLDELKDQFNIPPLDRFVVGKIGFLSVLQRLAHGNLKNEFQKKLPTDRQDQLKQLLLAAGFKYALITSVKINPDHVYENGDKYFFTLNLYHCQRYTSPLESENWEMMTLKYIRNTFYGFARTIKEFHNFKCN